MCNLVLVHYIYVLTNVLVEEEIKEKSWNKRYAVVIILLGHHREEIQIHPSLSILEPY